jgi:hypothetical protein
MKRTRIPLALLCCAMCAAPAAAQSRALQLKINKAIDHGVEHLRGTFRDSRVEHAKFDSFTIGMTSLAAWTLLETGTPSEDPLIKTAAVYLRHAAVRAKQTYDLATALLFFDRLGRPGDEALIQGIALRLLAGQRRNGGWSYGSEASPVVEANVENYLRAAANNWRKNTGKAPRAPQELPVAVQQMLQAIAQQPPNDLASAGLPSDGSNTQFAMLALWVARRHGIPVDAALLRVGDLFRKTQIKNGGWPYRLLPGDESTRITMTCAGVLAIALEHGVAKKHKVKRPPLAEDDAANKGLYLVGDFLATPEQNSRLLESPGNLYYFLFTMERMAVVYDLKTIGDVDWYLWGAEKLVKDQTKSGKWEGLYDVADTCFALLFLKRANVARDLTLDLKGIVREPATAPKTPRKKERTRDPFEVPNIEPKDKKKKGARALWPGEAQLAQVRARSVSEGQAQPSFRLLTAPALKTGSESRAAALPGRSKKRNHGDEESGWPPFRCGTLVSVSSAHGPPPPQTASARG